MDKPWRDLTREERGALLLAHHEGKQIEYRRYGDFHDNWGLRAPASPWWSPDFVYRVKPQKVSSYIGVGDHPDHIGAMHWYTTTEPTKYSIDFDIDENNDPIPGTEKLYRCL